MAKQSLEPHGRFPHLYKKAQIQADPACGGCVQAGKDGHATCAAWRPAEPLTADERVSIKELRGLQGTVARKQRMSVGIPGAAWDTWGLYPGEGTANYVYFSVWELAGVSGDDDENLTLKCLAPETDPREFTLYTWSEPNPDNPAINITGYLRKGCIQPGDIIEFENSKIMYCSFPIIMQVLSVDLNAETITLRTDKNCDGAMTKFNASNPDPLKVKVYHYAAHPDQWHWAIKPDYFEGVQESLLIPASDITGDGLYTISSDRQVMHSGGFDPLHPTWLLEGYIVATDTWEQVPQMNERLFIKNKSAYVAFKTTKPVGSLADITLTDDLTTTYETFRVTFWLESNAATPACQQVGYKRCRHSLPDPSESVSNYEAGNGVSADNHYYCRLRLEDVFSEPYDTDSDGYDDKVDHSQKSPSGIADYPADGMCVQQGFCDRFEPAENWQDPLSPFDHVYDTATIMRDLWAASAMKRVQPQPDVSQYYVKTIKHSSLCWLAGYVRPFTEIGIHEMALDPRGNNTWGTTPIIRRFMDDDEYMMKVEGPFDGWFEGAEPWDDDPLGVYPTIGITDWMDWRDPADASNSSYEQREVERIHVGIERDSGAMVGTGLTQTAVAQEPQDYVFLTDVDCTDYDTVQQRPCGSFMIPAGGILPAKLQIDPLRQESKTPVAIGSRVVHSVASLGSNRYRITLANVEHKWSTIQSGPPPLDVIHTWQAGGGWPICPKPWQEVLNYYEPNKSTGSRARGAWRGDSIGIGDDRFIILDVEPFGGAAAPDWGGPYTPNDSVCLSFDYTDFARKRDTVDVLDDLGIVAALQPDDMITFYKGDLVAATYNATLQWTEYGTDNWQPVGNDAKFYYGRGLIEVESSWFFDKPNRLCFRMQSLRLMDNRGHVPASLYNKTVEAANKLEWCYTNFGSGHGTFGIGVSADITYTIDVDPDTGCKTGEPIPTGPMIVTPIAQNQNRVQIVKDSALAENGICGASMQVMPLAALGLPMPLRMAPEGTEILEARMAFTSTSLTRTFTQYRAELRDCDNNVVVPEFNPPPDVTITDINISLIGHKDDEDDWEVIGSVADVGEGRRVVDATTLIQTMYARAKEFPYGFSLAYLPPGYDGDITELVPDTPPDVMEYMQGACTPCGQNYVFNETWSIVLTWGSVSVDQLAIKLKLPEGYDDSGLIQPRWPSFADAPPE